LHKYEVLDEIIKYVSWWHCGSYRCFDGGFSCVKFSGAERSRSSFILWKIMFNFAPLNSAAEVSGAKSKRNYQRINKLQLR